MKYSRQPHRTKNAQSEPYRLSAGKLYVGDHEAPVGRNVIRIVLDAHRHDSGVDYRDHDGPIPRPIAERMLSLARRDSLSGLGAELVRLRAAILSTMTPGGE